MVSAQAVLVHGTVLSEIQSFAFAFVDLHELFVSMFLQFVKIRLSGSHTLWCIDPSSQFGVIYILNLFFH